MPTVPTVQGRQVESRGVSSPGFQTFDQPNVSDALVNVGSQALDVFGQAKQQADLALTQDATQRLYAVGSGLMDDPQGRSDDSPGEKCNWSGSWVYPEI